MRTVYDNIAIGSVLATYNSSPAVITTSPSVDTKGYNSACLRVYQTPVGAGIVKTLAVSTVAVLQESADNVTFTTALDNTGVAIGGNCQATTTAVISSFRVEGLGQQRLRYLRVSLQSGVPTTSSTAFISTTVAVIELGRGYQLPPTTAVSNT